MVVVSAEAARVRVGAHVRTDALRSGSGGRRPDRRVDVVAVLDEIELDAEQETMDCVVRAKSGDSLAFADLYIEFFDRVYRYLIVALKNRDDAQEAAQQVFVRVLEALPRYEPTSVPFHRWLFSIVRHLAVDSLRRAGHSTATDPDRMTVLVDHALCDDPCAGQSESAGVAALIDRLPRNQQRVLTLRFVFDFTAVDIADVLGTTPDAVRHSLQRALRTLAHTIDELCIGAN
jgi:RNA polymerase sigma-70 factor (ECF subfamily)